MTRYTLVQDGDVLEEFSNREEAASMVRSIAEAMRADATRLDRLADAVAEQDDNDLCYSGSYLEIIIERA